MRSRLLADLESAISNAPDQLTACRLRAELASHWARRESGPKASEALGELRGMNVKFGDPILSAWINVGDALILLGEGRQRDAVDRLERASAVARAAMLQREASVAWAWLAYVAYTRNDFASMVQRINDVLALGSAADASASARAHMLVGQSLHFVRQYDSARPWYESAKLLIERKRDDGLRSALMFNLATHHVSNYRQAVLRNQGSGLPLFLLELATESVLSYDREVGIDSLDAYANTLRASVHLFHERFDEAFEAFGTSIETAEKQGLGRMKSLYLSEMAYCALRMGRSKDEVTALAASAEAAVSTEVQIDDVASTHSRLAQINIALSDPAKYERNNALAVAAWNRQEQFEREVLAHLETVFALLEHRQPPVC